MIGRVGIWDLVLKDPDTMHVLQRNQQLALLSIIQVIHACNIQLVLPVTIVIGISKEDQAIMDLAHRIVDRDQTITIMDLQVDRIILQGQVDRLITMTTRMQPIAEQWEWQMVHLTWIRLKI